jgi:peptidyl-prolyl cis-trans isomerase A (cyclophilin A)
MRIGQIKNIAAACILAACIVSCGQPGAQGQPDGLYARLTTAKGVILVGLEYQKAPLTVGSFVGLAEGTMNASKGKKYFDGQSFHRVEPGFVVQTGDPKADGTGGPGYDFPNEIASDLKYDSEGVVGMANAGPNTNGSQFFITMAAVPNLNGGYTIFGKVVAGMDVVKLIAKGDKLVKVEILRNGSAARAFKADQAAFDSRLAPLVASIKKAADDKRAADVAAIKQRWPDLVPDADGIYQKTLKAGSGATPTSGVTVTVAYKGMLVSGQVFDQSDFHGGPAELQIGVGRVIPGWDKVVMQMKKGEKRMIVIPPELAYGSRGTPGGPIAPDSFLAFEVELVKIGN